MALADRSTADEHGPCVVLLGASNLTRGFFTVLRCAHALLGESLDVLAALGVGRSYGIYSNILGRGLSGVDECGLWPVLRERPSAPVFALLTDIGNDIPYEVPVPRITGWIESCLDKLAEAQASIVVTQIPLENIRKLDRWRFMILRSILFPGRTISFEEVSQRIVDLAESIEKICVARGITLVPMKTEWYGLDPIHIRRPIWPTAWSEILGHWTSTAGDGNHLGEATIGNPLWIRQLGLCRLAPETRRIFGIEWRRRQPVKTFKDGTTLSVY